MQILLSQPPFQHLDTDKGFGTRGLWPAFWVSVPQLPVEATPSEKFSVDGSYGQDGPPPFVAAYRLRVSLSEPLTLRVHVSADERYELFLNGERIGRGSERGDERNWFFESYELHFEAGEHLFAARVSSLGGRAAYAQHSVSHGFLFCPDDAEHTELFATGHAPWEARLLPGYAFTDSLTAWGTGDNIDIDGATFAWNWHSGQDDDSAWQPVAKAHRAVSEQRFNQAYRDHLLTPATLPPQFLQAWSRGVVRHCADLPELPSHPIPIRQVDNLPDEAQRWQAFLRGEELTVPANTRRRVLIDLEDYVCAYPVLETSGGASSMVRVFWQESLYEDVKASGKGNRDEIEGKYFVTAFWPRDGVGDVFRPDGGANRVFDTLWWQCGRYVEVVVETESEPLTLHALQFIETRYPIEKSSEFACSDERLGNLEPMFSRVLQMCSHETYMDCPYWEQLQYVGDTRLQMLMTYAISRDDRLARKALTMFDASRQVAQSVSGLTHSRYPSRVRQIIAPFSLWYVGALHDYALWCNDAEFVKVLLPGARGVLDYYANRMNADGLLSAPTGWNCVDWVRQWRDGVPPDGYDGTPPDKSSGVLNLKLRLAWRYLADLEAWHGEPELSQRASRCADELGQVIDARFWNEERSLYANELSHETYSEHAQCLAILGGTNGEKREQMRDGLLRAEDLHRCSIYFSHYLLETWRILGEPDALLRRLDQWFALPGLGFKTTYEEVDPNSTRSDCHAWGGHPMFHARASILGVRPASHGFQSVRIVPQLGALTHARGNWPHPNGDILVEVQRDGEHLRARVTLPPNLSGELVLNGQTIELREGEQEHTL